MIDGCDVRFILQTKQKKGEKRGGDVGMVKGQDWVFCDFGGFGLGGAFLALLARDCKGNLYGF